jgi:5-(carboxyamino)imidazole ribonucleotide mutase
MTTLRQARSDEAMTQAIKAPIVGIIMGSRSDWGTMSGAKETLDALEIPCEVRVVSAHRMPDEMFEYAASAARRGLAAIIAGAGGAAHLPGMTAAKTPLPVIGVPVESARMAGLDSLLSIVQMPPGVPVATMAVGGAVNAALFAARIVALQDAGVAARLAVYVARMHDAAAASVLD